MQKKLVLFVVLLSLLVCIPVSANQVRIGSKAFTEQLIIGEMMSVYLQHNGYRVDFRPGMGSSVVRQALEVGELDLYAEYDGTAWTVHLGQSEILPRQEQYQRLKALDLEKNELIWLNSAPINNTYALAMRQDISAELGIDTISQLAEYIRQNDGKVRFATDHEFVHRPDGIPGLENRYDFTWERSSILTVRFGITHMLLQEGEVQVAMVFGTDPQIARWNFKILDDDLNFFPYYDLAPVVRKEFAEQNPQVVDLLNELFGRIDAATMRELNAQVEFDMYEPDEVAEEFLQKQGLI